MRERKGHALIGFFTVMSLSGALVNACSAAGDNQASGTGAGAGSPTSTGTNAGGGSSTTLTGGGNTDIDASGNTGSGGLPDGCASVTSEATSELQPADIIIAVDTSGSMDEESGEVQANLNNFASIIVGSGIDVHVIMIASASVCIAAPLGSGACPGDESLPGYQHVVQSVGSNDGLQVILNTYPQWKSSLRPNATKTIAIVSDDDSDLSAQDFTNQLLALDPPTFQGFKFDAIVAFQDPVSCEAGCFASFCQNCGKCCPNCNPLAAAEGTVYKQLVSQTGGVIGDLCDQDFDAVFQSMATSVVGQSMISCEYDIPVVPDGGMIDPTKVNVSYTPGGGMAQPIGNVPGGAADCTPQTGGWYYDNPANPTKIILCPSTCTAVQGDSSGKVDVIFGCDTIIAVPD